MSSTNVDLSQPLATVLRDGTAEVHHSVSVNNQGAAWLTGGKLDKEEYIRFLMILWHVYE